MRKILKALGGMMIMPFSIRSFDPSKVLEGKRVAVVGAAGSALQEEMGAYIDDFDIVVRINKAMVMWNPGHEKYIGKRTDILFHSFYENNESGGGKLDFDLFDQHGISYVVNPICNFGGIRLNYNFYKKYLKSRTTCLLSRGPYQKMMKPFGRLRPTVGYAALFSVLSAPCKEVYLTGFTFFKTPYASGYRDHLVDMEANRQHIVKQGIHDPDLEFNSFRQTLKFCQAQKVVMDKVLSSIVEQAGNDGN